MDKFIYRLPWKTISLLLFLWIFLILLNFGIIETGIYTDAPQWFPISIFFGPTIHWKGFPYLVLFLIVLFGAIKYASRLKIYHVWFLGLCLIVFGNLGQGDLDRAFRKPFYDTRIQYYSDAIKISSGVEWLEEFNYRQPELKEHARTHPPFAVLIHYIFLRISDGNITFLAMMFVLISSLSIIIVWNIFRILGMPMEERNLIAILFSVIPAFNIYSGVSLDGIILTSTTLFLFGMLVIIRSNRLSLIGIFGMSLGMVFTNYLTYGGLFLVGVAGIYSVREYVLKNQKNVTIAFLISIITTSIIAALLFYIFHYNHIRGFFTASILENPDGFRAWSEPLAYLSTRVEGVSEIAVFLSIGVLAMLFHPRQLKISWFNWRDNISSLTLSSVFVLLAIIFSGAYKTGETARTALFFYPFLLLVLRNLSKEIIKDLIIFAGLQTFVMQLCGGYFW